MEQRQIDGVDTYNFSTELVGHPLLGWMGDDYVRFIVTELLRRFRQQDTDTEMVAIKCEERPKLLTTADEQTNTVRDVIGVFDLQILLRAGNGQHWRLRGDGRFSATGLDRPERLAVSTGFTIRSTEEAV